MKVNAWFVSTSVLRSTTTVAMTGFVPTSHTVAGHVGYLLNHPGDEEIKIGDATTALGR